MTVRRHFVGGLDASPPAVAAAVRLVLSRNPPYRRSIETEGERIFKTNVKPSRWLLGTDMVVQLHPSAEGTRIDVKTKSQWFIVGDVFGYYNWYIRELVADVRNELQ